MVTFEPDQVSTWSEYKRAWRHDNAEAAAAARTKYRHSKSKWITDAEYLRRRVVMIDGEGVNRPNGRHDYILLAISDVPPITNKRRLRTMAILHYLWKHLEAEDLNVVYGASYDWNMWLQDLGRPAVKRLYASNFFGAGVTFGPYQLKWMRGKSFTIKRDGKSITIYDVLPFFQRPFVQACDEYLGTNPVWQEARETIVREKARRGVFTVEELQNVAAYNSLELDVGRLLVEELRARLNRVNLRPRRWDGPGAIAAALMLREGVKAHRAPVPDFAARAARYAYFGGRFEVIQYGRHDAAAYEYDVNSAYPAALAQVPSLAGATWEQYAGDAGQHPFALYRVRVRMPKAQVLKHDGRHLRIPGPVPCRTPQGNIVYPMNAETWVWSPEMETLRLYARKVPGVTFRVLETITCTPATDVKPFGFIPALYLQRAALKRAKDGAHVGLKLGANSLYGKLCQQVGWVPAMPERRLYTGRVLPGKPARLPPFHQLEWGGFATSWCRARVLRAALADLDAVIAFETDAVFSSRPLSLPVSDALGDFEQTIFADLTYVQSGHYYGTKVENGERTPVVKCRGVDRGFVSREAVERAMFAQAPWSLESKERYPATLTRFMGAGVALARDFRMWGRWMTEPKVLQLGPSGKRVHHAPACGCGRPGDALAPGLHTTYCPATGNIVSSEFPVAWINPDPRMTDLEEARTAETDWESLE